MRSAAWVFLAPLVVSVVLAAVCAPGRGVEPRRARVEPGQSSVWIYLLGDDEADDNDLRLRLAGLEAVARDGSVVTLAVPPEGIDAAPGEGPRLLSAFAIPPGSYRELRFHVESAEMRSPRGDAGLSVPDGPITVEIEFGIAREGASVLYLTPSAGGVSAGRTGFALELRAKVPAEPAAGLYAAAVLSDTGMLGLFDKVSGDPFAMVPGGREPSSVVLSRDRMRAFVALAGDHQVIEVGLQETAVLQRLALGAGDQPAEIDLGPEDRLLVTANRGSGTVSVIDARTLTETDRIRVGEEPRGVRIDPAGRVAVVMNTLSDTVSVIDLGYLAVARTLTVDAEPFRGTFDPSGERFYVIHRASPYVSVIDMSSRSVVNRFYAGPGATDIAVDPLTRRIFLARAGTGTVEVYDPSSLLPVDFIPLDDDVLHLAIDSEGHHMLAALRRTGRVLVVRLANKRTVANVDLGGNPVWVALMGER